MYLLQVLDDKVEKLVALFAEVFDIGEEELGDPSAITEVFHIGHPICPLYLMILYQGDVTVAGRIVFDSETSTGSTKLNEASIALESHRMGVAGSRTPLKFAPNVTLTGGENGTKNHGLFPGAVILCRGRNGGDGCFLVNEIFQVRVISAY